MTGTARTKLTQLRRHMAALEKASPTPTGKAAWGTEVAAIDKLLSELSDVDDATRVKLAEVRTHITAYATAMSHTATPAPPTPAPPSSTSPPVTEPRTSTKPTTPPTEPPPAEPPVTATPPATTTPPTTQPPTPQPPATPPPATPTTTVPPTQPPSTATPTQPPQPATPTTQTTPPTTQPTPTPPASPAPAGKPDPEAAKRHLTAARDLLSQLTQMPEAAQLSGDARRHASELITNFNELITTQTEWRASYAKVQANLNALIGPADAAAPASGTPGAVGTSGMPTLDPKIRAKLVEFRAKLAEFETVAAVKK